MCSASYDIFIVLDSFTKSNLYQFNQTNGKIRDLSTVRYQVALQNNDNNDDKLLLSLYIMIFLLLYYTHNK